MLEIDDESFAIVNHLLDIDCSDNMFEFSSFFLEKKTFLM